MDNEYNEVEEVVEEEVIETPEETTEEVQEEETVVEKPQETLEARKARLERQLEQTNKKLGVDSKQTTKTSKQSNGLDYGAKAFLTTNGIKGAKEFEFVEKELKASGESLDSLLENDYFQARLEKFRAINTTTNAIPKGSRSTGTAMDSVEYWQGKPFEEVPKDMRRQVLNARLKKETTNSKFYNS